MNPSQQVRSSVPKVHDAQRSRVQSTRSGAARGAVARTASISRDSSRTIPCGAAAATASAAPVPRPVPTPAPLPGGVSAAIAAPFRLERSTTGALTSAAPRSWARRGAGAGAGLEMPSACATPSSQSIWGVQRLGWAPCSRGPRSRLQDRPQLLPMSSVQARSNVQACDWRRVTPQANVSLKRPAHPPLSHRRGADSKDAAPQF